MCLDNVNNFPMQWGLTLALHFSLIMCMISWICGKFNLIDDTDPALVVLLLLLPLLVPNAYGRMSLTGPSNTVELFHGSPFFKVFYNFLSTSTMPSTLTLVLICSLISLL